jgi:hypothetical protein
MHLPIKYAQQFFMAIFLSLLVDSEPKGLLEMIFFTITLEAV